VKVRWLIVHVWRGKNSETEEPTGRFKLPIPADLIQPGDEARIFGVTGEEEGPWEFNIPEEAA
jgi:hypothetical protein